MKPTPISRSVLAVLALSTPLVTAAVQAAREPAPSAQGNLRRVDPRPEGQDPNDPRELFARAFDRGLWEERLQHSDLDQREQSLDALLQRARLDPVARAFLEELAADPAGGELAWTARLALRELGRASFPMQGFLGADPFGSAQRMQQWMDEIFRRDGFGMMLPHTSRQAPLAPGLRGSGRSVQVEQSERGVRVRITETVDGEPQTREYEGQSLEEILEKSSELKAELDGLSLRVQPGAPLDLRFDLGGRGLELRRFPRAGQPGLPPAPQGKSRPVLTDRLGVIVQPVGAARAKELDLEGKGLLVERAVPETYAHLLGVKAGDVLIELDGIELASPADIERAMKARAADEDLTLVWLDELGQRQEKTWKSGREPRKR